VETICRIVQTTPEEPEQRAAARQPLNLSGRLVWRDARATTRFASVRIQNISESGAFVECLGGTPVPLYRLVHLQAERPANHAELPSPLADGRVLAAVFRIDAAREPGAGPLGYGLRLLVEPSRTRSSRRNTALRPVINVASRSIA